MPTVSRAGYTFKGWYTAATNGTKVETTTKMGAADTTIYAQWTQNVSYFANATLFKNILTAQSVDTTTITSIKFTKSASDIPASPTKTFSIGASDNTGSTAYTSSSNCSDVTAYLSGTQLVIYSPYTIYAPVDSSRLFNLTQADSSTFSSLASIEFSNFDTTNVTNMQSMFSGCSDLTSLNVSNFNTLKVTNMANMFGNCSSLIILDLTNFVTSNVTAMHSMFNGCSSLKSLNVSGFNTSKVEIMNYMFYRCSSLTSLDVSSFDTSNVTVMWGIFSGCSGLTSLDVSNFDTSNVTDMDNMFSDCGALISLNLSNFVTSNVKDMAAMFYGCSGLTSLDISNFDTSNVTDMYSMFYGCSGLTSLDVSNFDMAKVTVTDHMLYDCSSLKTIQTPMNVKVAIDLPGSNFYKTSNLATSYSQIPVGNASITLKRGYTLTANANNGTIATTSGWTGSGTTATKVVLFDNNAISNFPSVSRSGYTFKGWYTSATDGTKVETTSTISANTTIYAQWIAKTISLTATYIGEGIEYSDTFTVNENSTVYVTVDGSIMHYSSLGNAEGGAYSKFGVIQTTASYSLNASKDIVTVNVESSDISITLYGYVTVNATYINDIENYNFTTKLDLIAEQTYYFVVRTDNVGSESIEAYTTRAEAEAYAYGHVNTIENTDFDNFEILEKITAIVSIYVDNKDSSKLTLRYLAPTLTANVNNNGSGRGIAGFPDGWTQIDEYTGSIKIPYGDPYGTLPNGQPDDNYTFKGWYTALTGGDPVTSSTIMGLNDVTIYAQYEAVKYSITYKDKGDATFSGTHESGYPTQYTWDTTTALKGATKTGYTFAGWYIDSNCSGTAITSLGQYGYSGDLTLYAKWTVNSYLLTAYANGGSVIETSGWTGSGESATKLVAFKSNYGTLPSCNAGVAGMTFDGWYTEEVGGTRVDNTTVMGAQATTIYARYTEITYRVNIFSDSNASDLLVESFTVYDENGNSETRTNGTGVKYGERFKLPTVENIVSWVISNDTALEFDKATWGKSLNDVTLALTKVENDRGVINCLPTDDIYFRYFPSVAGQFFYIYPIYEQTQKTLTFDLYFENTDSAPDYEQIEIAGDDVWYAFLNFADLKINGTRFWGNNPDGSSGFTINSQGHAVTSASGTITFSIGSLFTFGSGTLIEWVTNCGITGTNFSCTSARLFVNQSFGNVEITANTADFRITNNAHIILRIYQGNYYSLTCNSNGGIIIDPPSTWSAESTYSSTSLIENTTIGGMPSAVKTGYDFVGWYTTKDSGGTRVTSTDRMFSANTTLYARWSLKNIAINYILYDGGTNSDSNPTSFVYSASAQTVEIPGVPTRSGYKFLKWVVYGGATNGSVDNTSTPAVLHVPAGRRETITLVARWAKLYTVTFVDQWYYYNGTDRESKTCTIDFGNWSYEHYVSAEWDVSGLYEGATDLPVATLDGYQFLGWRWNSTAWDKVDIPVGGTFKTQANGNIESLLPVFTKAYTLSDTERSTGKVTMGKKSASSTAEDVEWKCFAYSVDGTTWTICTGEIPANAKYGYFVLDTYVSSLDNKVFLASDKYNSKTYMHTDISGATDVKANDYYYSDIRQTLKGLETTLNISSDNAIYKAIQGRTITDLYSSIKDDGSQLALPTKANGNDVDKFWLMSVDEVQTYFADDSARKWKNGNSSQYYWLRSPNSDSSDCACGVTYGDFSNVSYSDGVRAAFMLELR